MSDRYETNGVRLCANKAYVWVSEMIIYELINPIGYLPEKCIHACLNVFESLCVHAYAAQAAIANVTVSLQVYIAIFVYVSKRRLVSEGRGRTAT